MEKGFHIYIKLYWVKNMTSKKQKAASRRNIRKARAKWKKMSSKARKATMPSRKKRR